MNYEQAFDDMMGNPTFTLDKIMPTPKKESIMQDVGRNIKTVRKSRTISVDTWDRNEVYVAIRVSGGSCYCSLTLDQTRELIDALENVVQHLEEKNA